MAAFQKILCPTDFSEASYEALGKAVEVAGEGAAEVCVIHVELPARALTPYAGHAPEAAQEADRRAETVKNLRAVLEERVPQNLHVRPLLRQGEAAQEILAAAREENADLIVLTTHGAGGLAPGELGRVAATVVQHAPCAVLTINGNTNAPARAVDADFSAMQPDYKIAHASPRALFLDGD